MDEIRELSRFQRPLNENIRYQGPGGQSYDLAPTPNVKRPAEPSSMERWGGKTISFLSQSPWRTAAIFLGLYIVYREWTSLHPSDSAFSKRY